MTRALVKARVNPARIRRLARGFVREALDEQVLASMDFSTMATALKAAGISSWGNRHKIFQCFNSGECKSKTLRQRLRKKFFVPDNLMHVLANAMTFTCHKKHKI